jgi:multiple RNA-binding domain-containing protein 1
MKFGSHRGFAFVEYVTKQETQNALQALANTHLYGRHLVMDLMRCPKAHDLFLLYN